MELGLVCQNKTSALKFTYWHKNSHLNLKRSLPLQSTFLYWREISFEIVKSNLFICIWEYEYCVNVWYWFIFIFVKWIWYSKVFPLSCTILLIEWEILLKTKESPSFKSYLSCQKRTKVSSRCHKRIIKDT